MKPIDLQITRLFVLDMCIYSQFCLVSAFNVRMLPRNSSRVSYFKLEMFYKIFGFNIFFLLINYVFSPTPNSIFAIEFWRKIESWQKI